MPASSLPKTYDFKSTEQRLYAWWEESGYFKPSNDPQRPGFDPNREPFVISIPPANVTGELHLGHAMFVSMEDLMIRYQRMKGVPTLWVPGVDHAGIATQLQVEKMLHKEGLRREDVGREEFVRRTWEWKEKYGGIISQPDPPPGRLLRLAARALHPGRGPLQGRARGLRAPVREGTDLPRPAPDQLVAGVEDGRLRPGSGVFRRAGHPVLLQIHAGRQPDEYIPVATTRPETILGDTAVAVHPDDERYQKYVGRKVRVPILGREIPGHRG